MVGTQQLLRRLPNESSISFLAKEITPISSAKDLGIILDNNLTYDQHIHQLSSSYVWTVLIGTLYARSSPLTIITLETENP